jgi:hypothetical protein
VRRTEDDRTCRILGGRTIGRSGDVVCGLHHARGDEEREFLGCASKPRLMVCQWFGLKTTGMVYQWFDLKTTGTVFSYFASKLVTMISSNLASKSMASGFPVMASKSVALFW